MEVDKLYATSTDVTFICGGKLMTKQYKPVEGCEECEFWGEACAECMLYGEAKLIKPKTEENEDE